MWLSSTSASPACGRTPPSAASSGWIAHASTPAARSIHAPWLAACQLVPVPASSTRLSVSSSAARAAGAPSAEQAPQVLRLARHRGAHRAHGCRSPAISICSGGCSAASWSTCRVVWRSSKRLEQLLLQHAPQLVAVRPGPHHDVRGQRREARRHLPHVQVVDFDDARRGRRARGRSAAGRGPRARPPGRRVPRPGSAACRRTASSAATSREASASARTKPVARMIPPAIAVAMNANRSVRMCWKLPSTLRLSRLAPASTNVAARFTAIPTTATITTIAPSTSGGETSRWIASYDDPQREQHERDPVRLRAEDLDAAEAVRHRAARRPSRDPQRDERERERGRVGEHVRGVRQQRERGGEDAGDELGAHEADDQHERDRQRARVGVARHVGVPAVAMRVPAVVVIVRVCHLPQSYAAPRPSTLLAYRAGHERSPPALPRRDPEGLAQQVRVGRATAGDQVRSLPLLVRRLSDRLRVHPADAGGGRRPARRDGHASPSRRSPAA